MLWLRTSTPARMAAPTRVTSSGRVYSRYSLLSMMALSSAACTNALDTLAEGITRTVPRPSAALVRVHSPGGCTEFLLRWITPGLDLSRFRYFPSTERECVGEPVSSSTATAGETRETLATVVSSSTVAIAKP